MDWSAPRTYHFARDYALHKSGKSPTWKNIPYAFLFAIILYLCCATTIHPWYTLLPLVICAFTRFRFPVIWTGLVFSHLH
ncbi:MAG: hypothetical protein HC892_05475 [Saprospiraceae bacterium]|nr:hypothetical protein [Saprospiraceae bacterium]